mmetsp:Transcript_44026/g.71669  ORF Transcript_44026/g.71669 Transcript_44026/m.71669 type:complete len:127 (+) Transcript_44026:162-542(+)
MVLSPQKGGAFARSEKRPSFAFLASKLFAGLLCVSVGVFLGRATLHEHLPQSTSEPSRFMLDSESPVYFEQLCKRSVERALRQQASEVKTTTSDTNLYSKLADTTRELEQLRAELNTIKMHRARAS